MRDPAVITAAIARTRLALAREDVGRPVYRATPGCDRGCAQCDIRCAILTGELDDLHNELDAVANAQPIMRHAGRFYAAIEGIC